MGASHVTSVRVIKEGRILISVLRELELRLAGELQSEMLPAYHPPEAGWDLAVRSSAAQTVGGDFYDFFRYPGKAISAEAIGDASGKGASAAIYAALAWLIRQSKMFSVRTLNFWRSGIHERV